MATPALRALRARFARSRIALLARPNTLEVLNGGPWMDEMIAWQPPRRGLGRVAVPLGIASRLARHQFDLAVLLSNSFRTALAVKLARIPRRVGYARDGRGLLLTDRLLPPKTGGTYDIVSAVRYYNQLAKVLGCDEPGETLELFTIPADEALVDARLAGWGVAGHQPLVVVNPGAAFGSSKLWIPERYAEVADRLIDERDACVLITCGPGEEPLAWRIHAAMRRRSFVVDRPRGTLGQLKSLIKRCDLLLNNDTGPRHFAKALGRPVVTVFGSTHPAWTHTNYARERVVRIDVDCGPCQKKVCPLGHHECMTGVTADMVFNAAVALLDERGTKVALPQARTSSGYSN